MAELFPITLDDAIAELVRERGMRGRVYGLQIAQHKLAKAEADRRMARIDFAINALERQRDAEKAARNG